MTTTRSSSTDASTPHNGSTLPSGEPNMLGTYGPWADGLHGNQPGEFSFRNSRWNDVDSWKKAAKERVSKLVARPDTGGTPEVSVILTDTYRGLVIQELSWQLPFGPPTAAYFVKPQGEGPFPGIIAMHDHGGNKYFGCRKIVRLHDMHPLMIDHQQKSYGGRALANELAKRGFAVLVPDVFTFASRRVLLQNVHPRIRNGVQDVSSSENPGEIDRYNGWAANHEHIMAKSLFSAGTTWPGVFLSEDQRSLDVLASRPEVDADKLGCIGLSGGGLRTVMLTGMDSRIKTGVAAGMVSTWRDYSMYHSFIHTWMAFMPHLPRYLDYSEIFGLNLSACLVLNNTSDQLFDLGEMKQAEQYLAQVYEKAGMSEKFKAEYYPGNHKFDGDMQDSAYQWMIKWLGEKNENPDVPSIPPPQEMSLGNNFPNPFRTKTKIPINIPYAMNVNLSVFNSLGVRVKLIINKTVGPGFHEVPFNGSDLSSGVYYYVLKTKEGTLSKKMLFLK